MLVERIYSRESQSNQTVFLVGNRERRSLSKALGNFYCNLHSSSSIFSQFSFFLLLFFALHFSSPSSIKLV